MKKIGRQVKTTFNLKAPNCANCGAYHEKGKKEHPEPLVDDEEEEEEEEEDDGKMHMFTPEDLQNFFKKHKK